MIKKYESLSNYNTFIKSDQFIARGVLMRNKEIIYSWAMTIALVLMTVAPAAASFTVSGAGFETTAVPGEHIQHEIEVKIDDTDSPTDVVAEVMGLYQDPKSGVLIGAKAEEDKSPYSARGFLKVTPTSQHIESGKSAKFLLEGDIPEDVGDGGRYAIVDVHSLPTGEGQIGVAVAVAVPVKITVSGSELIHTGEISSLELEDPISAEAPICILNFTCTGNHAYFYNVDANLMDGSGNVLSNTSEPCPDCDAPRAVPGYSRELKLSFDLDEELEPGTYNIEATSSLEDGTVLDTEKTDFKI